MLAHVGGCPAGLLSSPMRSLLCAVALASAPPCHAGGAVINMPDLFMKHEGQSMGLNAGQWLYLRLPEATNCLKAALHVSCPSISMLCASAMLLVMAGVQHSSFSEPLRSQACEGEGKQEAVGIQQLQRQLHVQ